MAKADVWPVVHLERKALAAELAGLRDDQWDRASLCDRWSVRDVLAHMTATAEMTGPRFFAKLIGSGFSLTRLQTKDIARSRGATPADTLAAFERRVDTTTGPPGPAETMLGETIVHAEDIRRPLGIAHTYPLDAVVRVADFYKASDLIIGAKRRIATDRGRRAASHRHRVGARSGADGIRTDARARARDDRPPGCAPGPDG